VESYSQVKTINNPYKKCVEPVYGKSSHSFSAIYSHVLYAEQRDKIL